jgi:hypothetical protein
MGMGQVRKRLLGAQHHLQQLPSGLPVRGAFLCTRAPGQSHNVCNRQSPRRVQTLRRVASTRASLIGWACVLHDGVLEEDTSRDHSKG